jgi:serine/threonine-protein kinase
MSSDARVRDLLLRWEELRERGQPAEVDDLCRDSPELAEELRRQIRALKALDPLLRTVPGRDEQAVTPALGPSGGGNATEAQGEGPSPPFSLPDVPGYQLLRELARGGMGVVYEARQTALGRPVALKMILSGAHASDAQRQRFRAEVEAVARLQHPNIVQIYEVGEVDHLPYCALEFVGGGSLAETINGTPQPPRQAAALAATLAEAVQAAHAQGVVHRDLKPGNVLLTPGGTPKVADFGLAKRLDGGSTLTPTGQVVGTPSYMAPEQAEGKKEVGPAADVYALGAILYELLTGRPPFKAETPLDTLLQVVNTEPVPPGRLQPKVPHDLDTICLKCLEKDPRRRYASAQDLADDLRHFLKGEPIRARPVPPWERALKWARRRPAAAALLAVSGLAVLGLLLLSLGYDARLQAQRDEADRQRLQALREKEQVELLRRQAEANFQLARRAVDDYAKTLSDDEHEPVENLRRDLLQSALVFYEEFVKQRGDDPALRAAQGLACLRLARISGEMGAQEAQALPLYRQALDIFERLAHDDPDNAGYREDLALVRYYQGRAFRDLGDLRQADDSLTQARALQQALLEQDPTSRPYRHRLADLWFALGQVYADREGESGRAGAAYQTALGIMDELARRQPPTAAEEDTVGDIYASLGRLYHAEGQREQARGAYEKALAIEQKLVREHPATVNYRSDLAASYYGLGGILYAEGNRQEAWADHQKAREIREHLVEEHGGVTNLVVDLGKSYRALGHQSTTPEARIEWFSKAIETLQGVLRKEPRQTEARSQLQAAYEGRARALNRLGRPAEALADWGQVEELGGGERRPVRLGLAETLARLGRHAEAVNKAAALDREKLSAEQRVDLARVYAACSRAAGAGAQVPEPQRERLAEGYAARAVALLAQAQMGGLFQTPEAQEELRQDPDFAPLRARQDFQQLLRRPK